MQDRAAAFAKHAQDWERYTTTPLGRLRQELVLAHLQEHTGALPTPAMVLDAGAGSGGYALALAQQGHRVHLLDVAEDMLNLARWRLSEADPALLERVEFSCSPVEVVAERLPSEHFDLVLAHTLLEYVDEPWDVLRGLIQVLAPGGLLSLLLVNPRAEAFRLAWAKRDLQQARKALTESLSKADLFGLPRRGLHADRIRQELSEAQVDTVAEYGVRIFADYFSSEELADPNFLARLQELEAEASHLEPYKGVARYLHILATKRS
jgi:S-adenosylmethionine-dependent methyltransferase